MQNIEELLNGVLSQFSGMPSSEMLLNQIKSTVVSCVLAENQEFNLSDLKIGFDPNDSTKIIVEYQEPPIQLNIRRK